MIDVAPEIDKLPVIPVVPLTVSLSFKIAPLEVTDNPPLIAASPPVTDKLLRLVVPVTVSLSPNSAPLEVTDNPPVIDVAPPVTDKLLRLVVPVTMSVFFKVAFSLTSRPLFNKTQY